jgi:hypothetical protein
MILSGIEIKKRLGKDIIIEPYEDKFLNPNSYNLTLHDELLVYKESLLDMKKPNETQLLKIPESGFVIEPGRLYLGRTRELTETRNLVPMLEGRSSIGRLGLFVHITARFSVTSVFADSGLLRSRAFSRCAFIPVCRFARSFIIPLRANSPNTRAASTRATPVFSLALSIKISNSLFSRRGRENKQTHA